MAIPPLQSRRFTLLWAALAAGTRLIEATLRALRLVELCGGKKLSRVQAATLRKATEALEAEPRIIDW
jgi:hypothetical protein